MAERHNGVQDAHPGLRFTSRDGHRGDVLPAAEPCENEHLEED